MSGSDKLRWCDLSCEFASFPEEDSVDGSKSCRTFLAISCGKLNRYVQKNTPCAAGLKQESGGRK